MTIGHSFAIKFRAMPDLRLPLKRKHLQTSSDSEHVTVQSHPINTSQADTKGDTHVFDHEVGILQ